MDKDTIKMILITPNVSIRHFWWSREKNETAYQVIFTFPNKNYTCSNCFNTFGEMLIYTGLMLRRMELNSANHLMNFITAIIEKNAGNNTALSEFEAFAIENHE